MAFGTKKYILEFGAQVIHGRGRGFKTANLDVIDLKIPHGVYLVQVLRQGKTYKGLMHFGPRATFHDSISTEVFLADFHGDLHGQKITVRIHKKIREVLQFPTAEALKAQIEKDKEWLK